MVCKKCGTSVSRSDKFCPKCGNLLKKQKSKWKIVTIILICILILGIIGGLFIKEVYMGKESKKVVSEFLQSYQKLDEDKCEKYLYTNSMYPTEQKFSDLQKTLAKNIKFQIKGAKEKEKYTVVEVKITNVNFEKIMKTIIEEQIESEEKVENKIENMISSGKEEKKEYMCNVNVYQVGEERKIEITESLSNALLGGFPEYVHSLIPKEN